MAHETLKTLITNSIKTNGRNAITAQILQDVLIAMVDECPDITGYATKTWVQNQGYAKATELSGYLPLTGGTLTGDLNIGNSSKLNFGTSYIYQSIIPGPHGANMGHILNFYGVDGYGYYNFDNSVHATSFIKENGTSAQFLKADGSVDENTYLPVVNGTISVSSGDMDIYSAGQQGGMATVFEAKDSQDVVFMGSPSYLFDGDVHASAFVKTNGISDEVLCADGSVKTLSELKAALNAV